MLHPPSVADQEDRLLQELKSSRQEIQLLSAQLVDTQEQMGGHGLEEGQTRPILIYCTSSTTPTPIWQPETLPAEGLPLMERPSAHDPMIPSPPRTAALAPRAPAGAARGRAEAPRRGPGAAAATGGGGAERPGAGGRVWVGE